MKTANSHFLFGYLLVSATLCFTSCSGDTAPAQTLRIATTTSTRDSGLLDVLIPKFEQQHNCSVDVIAVGTGAALAYGERGEVDAVMVHAPEAEEEFISGGHGVDHIPFMHNEFIFVGPSGDPSQLSGTELHVALATIRQENVLFVSRGDDSGTHKREMQLWAEASITPDHEKYTETGQGMGNSLVIANQLQGYTLTDFSTYLKFKNKLNLEPVAIKSDSLINRYSLITVNPEKTTKINSELASAFAEFLMKPTTAEMIRDYEIGGQQLFVPYFLNGQVDVIRSDQ